MSLERIGKLNVSNLAGLVPMASSEEQLALQEDIRMNGLQVPLVLYKGEIIDGRCRALACENLEIEPTVTKLPYETTLKEATAKVMSLNIRRNLTQTQKAITAYYQWKKDSSLVKKDLYTAWGVDAMMFRAANILNGLQPSWTELLFQGLKVPIGVHQKDVRGKLRQRLSSSVIAVSNWAQILDDELERAADHQRNNNVKDSISELDREPVQVQQEYHKILRALEISESKIEKGKKVITVNEFIALKHALIAARSVFKNPPAPSTKAED